jgi:hypothetical protein
MLVNTVVNQIVNEKQINDLRAEYCFQNDNSCKDSNYTGLNSAQKLLTDMTPYLKANTIKMTYTSAYQDSKVPIYNILGASSAGVSPRDSMPGAYLQDGSIIYIPAPANTWPDILVDTNGYKPPNRYGYDVFWWRLQGTKVFPQAWDQGDGQNCQLVAGNWSGTMCGMYAAQDKCPWDDTKGYWECLP